MDEKTINNNDENEGNSAEKSGNNMTEQNSGDALAETNTDVQTPEAQETQSETSSIDTTETQIADKKKSNGVSCKICIRYHLILSRKENGCCCSI